MEFMAELVSIGKTLRGGGERERDNERGDSYMWQECLLVWFDRRIDSQRVKQVILIVRILAVFSIN
jgi:hypothetical protein